MGQKIHQRVGLTDYKGTYEVKGDQVEVTIDSVTQSAAIGNQGALYRARDVLRSMVREREQDASPGRVEGGPIGIATIRAAARVRACHAVDKLLSVIGEQRMLEALSRATEVDALIHLLSDANATTAAAAQTEDPLRNARARATEQHLALLRQEGGTIGGAEVAERLRLTRGGVDARRKAGRLLAVEGGSRTVAYPAWQLDERGVLPGFEAALLVLPVVDPMMRVSFFLTRDPDLGERPLDALRRGRLDDVRDAAARFGRLGDEG